MANTKRNLLLGLAVAAALGNGLPGYAQDPNQSQNPQQQPSSGGWRKFGDNRQVGDGSSANGSSPSSPVNPEFAPEQQMQQRPQYQQAPPVGRLTVPAGTWITIRVDQPLASNHNQPGDVFTGTLAQPVVAEGRVVARRGQMITGRVVGTQTVTRVKGASVLGLEVTEMALVDGQQVPVHTQFVERRGGSSTGDNVAAVGVTTGMGAAIGAAAGGGVGAGIGAIAGAAASTIGVLVAHGKPAVVYPEQVLTFRLDAPVAISTERSEQSFEPVGRQDYDRAPSLRQAGPPPPVAYYPRPYYYGGYPGYFYGPSFGFGYGYGFYGGRGYYGRGWRR